MKNQTIAKRYARALLAIASETNAIDDIGRELAQIVAILDKSPELDRVFLGVSLDRHSRAKVMTVFLKQCQLLASVESLINLLSKKGRLDQFRAIVAWYHKFADSQQNRVVMTVVSASELAPAQFDSLKHVFEKKTGQTVILKTAIDASVIGGVRVLVGDHVYDATLSNQLARVGQKLGRVAVAL